VTNQNNCQNGNGKTSCRDVALIIGLVSIVSCCGFPILGEWKRKKTDQKSPGVVAPATQSNMFDFMKYHSEKAIRQYYPSAQITFGDTTTEFMSVSAKSAPSWLTKKGYTIYTLHGTLKMYGTPTEPSFPWHASFNSTIFEEQKVIASWMLDNSGGKINDSGYSIEKPSFWVD
jgi:hypothetical protein